MAPSLLYQTLGTTPNLGLKSKEPPWSTDKKLPMSNIVVEMK